jgi:NAD(P)-dependent dehydrogenase (short-subunit alcohol dehydrogenase family)
MNQPSNPVIVITGAAGNLGRALAQRFAESPLFPNARLALVDLNAEGLKATAATLPSSVQTISIPTNLLEPDSVQAMAEQVRLELGRCSFLANIAGGFAMGKRLHEADDKEWNLMMGLNAQSVFHVSRALIPHMLEQQFGRIVSVSARAAREGKAKMAIYCASKAAVLTLTESMAAEYKFDGINVNCILPGTIDTPQNRADMPDANFGNWVDPSELADVVTYLCSPAASAVTGAAVPVYGRS